MWKVASFPIVFHGTLLYILLQKHCWYKNADCHIVIINLCLRLFDSQSCTRSCMNARLDYSWYTFQWLFIGLSLIVSVFYSIITLSRLRRTQTPIMTWRAKPVKSSLFTQGRPPEPHWKCWDEKKDATPVGLGKLEFSQQHMWSCRNIAIESFNYFSYSWQIRDGWLVLNA